jgi:hypothetical protein
MAAGRTAIQFEESDTRGRSTIGWHVKSHTNPSIAAYRKAIALERDTSASCFTAGVGGLLARANCDLPLPKLVGWAILGMQPSGIRECRMTITVGRSEVRAQEIMQMIRSGAITPDAEIALELGVPLLAKATLKLRAGDLQKLMLDTRTVSDVLQRCYVQRRIFYDPFNVQILDACVASAKEIVDELRDAQKGISGIGKNAALSELLREWEDISVFARQRLEDLFYKRKNSGVDMQQTLESEREFFDTLREYRIKSLPIVEALIAMLPKDTYIRHNAEEKMEKTRWCLLGSDLALISNAWRLPNAI